MKSSCQENANGWRATCRCAMRRASAMYYLRVPPTIETAEEAVAWTFGLNTDEYHPAQES